MDEQDRRPLKSFIEKIKVDADADWPRVHGALARIDESLRAGTDGWRSALDELVKALPTRSKSGLNDSLPKQPARTAPEQTRDLISRLIRRLGPPPAEKRKPDDSA